MATTSREKKRIRVTRKPKSCPNPLFEKWLKELKDDAVKNDSRLQYVYGKALKSLQKYPLVLESAKECKVLQHFGEGLCKILDKKLAQHLSNGGSLTNDSNVQSSSEDSPPSKKISRDEGTPQKSKEYIPARPKPRTHIESRTPTKSNGILQPADIIFIDDDEFDIYPQRTISLNSNGQSAVQKPIEVAVPSVPIHRVVERIAEEETDSYSHARDMVTLKAGEYEIILCVDCAEVSGSSGSGNNQKEAAAKAFQNCGVPYDVRKLTIGDYLWICKPKGSSGVGTDRELVLPYVVERKRMDDLVSSMKDGRFKEQKFRLKHSGLPRPIYLIEEHGNRQNLGLPETSVLQAIANTLVIEKFQVQWTHKSDESIRFLVAMTKQLTELYRRKTVVSRSCREEVGNDWQTRLVTFKELYVNSTKSKPLSVTQMFAKQLMQLSGLSGDKAKAIVQHYPTPSLLIEALKAAGSSAPSLLASVEYGKSKKKLGFVISGHLAKLYTASRLDT
uniref:Crossover junction endonuclease MUS81 n=1 Tax=Megafenestra aurita TaxID=2291010 RepID=A0A4Y7NJ74_9CRUS|nr:EOG090X06E6 [Megafenestra aurita]SVE92395.1 EOG090X06E6 [Megafenestra aurita]